METIFRRNPFEPGQPVTDVFEDACVWVRDGEAVSVHTLEDSPRELDLQDVPTSCAGLRALLEQEKLAGLVFSHADGRQAQIRREDFAL